MARSSEEREERRRSESPPRRRRSSRDRSRSRERRRSPDRRDRTQRDVRSGDRRDADRRGNERGCDSRDRGRDSRDQRGNSRDRGARRETDRDRDLDTKAPPPDHDHRPDEPNERRQGGRDRKREPKSFLDKAEETKRKGPEKFSWGRESDQSDNEEDEEPPEPEFKPNFGLSGALAKDERTGNMVKGVVLKFTEPAEAALPDKDWRLYVYKGEELLEKQHIHRRSCFLFGRDDRVADIPLQHPSISSQHAIIQFRTIEKKVITDEGDRDIVKLIKPYLMDLNSTNGTFLNGTQIEGARYYELRKGDLIKYGTSSRDFVILHGDSAVNQAPSSP